MTRSKQEEALFSPVSLHRRQWNNWNNWKRRRSLLMEAKKKKKKKKKKRWNKSEQMLRCWVKVCSLADMCFLSITYQNNCLIYSDFNSSGWKCLLFASYSHVANANSDATGRRMRTGTLKSWRFDIKICLYFEIPVSSFVPNTAPSQTVAYTYKMLTFVIRQCFPSVFFFQLKWCWGHVNKFALFLCFMVT